jgi:hypothetical protein
MKTSVKAPILPKRSEAGALVTTMVAVMPSIGNPI